LDPLVEQLAQRDPTILEHIDLKNSRRVLRALEVSLGSGKSWLSFQEKKTNTSFEVLRFVISWPREVLYSRINLRVDQMILEGLEAEVFGLNHLAHLAPMNTVGYMEWIDFFKGKTNREFVINTIKQHTRNYAKRQLTWLNRYDQLTQLDPLQPVGLFEQLKDSIEKYH
jgi:tRNA dimethylallyltransferase